MKNACILSLVTIGSLIYFTNTLLAQATDKKIMNPDVYDIWNDIESPLISANGAWAAYTLKPGAGDPLLALYQIKSGTKKQFARADQAKFTHDAQYLIFKIHPPEDTLIKLRRRKVKKDALPQDTLAILNLNTSELTKIPDIKQFSIPEKWDGYIAYQVLPNVTEDSQAETDTTEETHSDKKFNEKNGYPLILRQLASQEEDTLQYVTDYLLAEEGAAAIISSTGTNGNMESGVYIWQAGADEMRLIKGIAGKVSQLAIDRLGEQAAFVATSSEDTARLSNIGLYHWQANQTTTLLADSTFAPLPKQWQISTHYQPHFSKDGTKLFGGIAPRPVLEDTTLLPEEIVQVEVWNYQDGRLYTQQEVRADEEKKRAYEVVFHLESNEYIQLADTNVPELILGDEGNAKVALGYDESAYLQYITWLGSAYKDVYTISLADGEKNKIATQIMGNPLFSPEAAYIYWYSSPDSQWIAYEIATAQTKILTQELPEAFFDELNDRPMHPWSYGLAGWTEADRHVLLYDRYDIWKIDPKNPQAAVRLTEGRESRTVYRYSQLDPEARSISSTGNILLHQFNELTKASGYARLDLATGNLTTLIEGDYRYSNDVQKAREGDMVLFTRENFQTFPNLVAADTLLQNIQTISDANPQQSEYRWGTIELYEWQSLDGKTLEGMLVKPEDFDPSKKYPMIVNFYERSSDGLHRHHAPSPGRSTINYAYYVNRGYIIFNPNVVYREGYPGESAYNCVIPGVTSLIEAGFVDKDRIGVQGHSWGGYQISYLLTRTNIFRCAEAGAPVVNMISAYGGIRWGSGLSRMFQYERTQSRIGGTLWEYPLRYIENSPIFTADKIETPVLILHNDEDGAVPWYQGIEFFVALRRLGKPAWLLNYNKEPHWPVKLQNRKDFNLRLEQFFDHYLMDEPAPKWMTEGVSPLKKGIEQGYETMSE